MISLAASVIMLSHGYFDQNTFVVIIALIYIFLVMLKGARW